MTTATAMTYSSARNASSSERSGLKRISGVLRLDDVDRQVDDDPHDVDEVPVDARHLDAAVLLGREVPAERPDRREDEQRQPDRHVRAVQAGQPVEDRALRERLRRDALARQVDVLVDLDEEERRAEQR